MLNKGTWQLLWAEFIVDSNAYTGVVAIEKGIQNSLSAILSVKDISLTSRTIIPNLLKNSGSSNTLDGWRAREGITLEPSENDGVRISGTQQSGWNYAVISLSDSHIEPGAIYRLEAWMKVDDISDNRYPHI